MWHPSSFLRGIASRSQHPVAVEPCICPWEIPTEVRQHPRAQPVDEQQLRKGDEIACTDVCGPMGKAHESRRAHEGDKGPYRPLNGFTLPGYHHVPPRQESKRAEDQDDEHDVATGVTADASCSYPL